MNTKAKHHILVSIQFALQWLAQYKTIPAVEFDLKYYDEPSFSKMRNIRSTLRQLNIALPSEEDTFAGLDQTVVIMLADKGVGTHGGVLIDVYRNSSKINLYFDCLQGTVGFSMAENDFEQAPSQYSMAIAVAIYKFLNEDLPNTSTVIKFLQDRSKTLETMLGATGLKDIIFSTSTKPA